MDILNTVCEAIEGQVENAEEIMHDLEEALDLYESMSFSEGDPKTTWSKRQPGIFAYCSNCQNSWIIAYLPMPSQTLARVVARAGFCARCLEADNVLLLDWKSVSRLASRTTDPRKVEFKTRRETSLPSSCAPNSLFGSSKLRPIHSRNQLDDPALGNDTGKVGDPDWKGPITRIPLSNYG